MLWDAFCRTMNEMRADTGPCIWIVGFSGGMDSMVLLDLCCRFRDEIDPQQRLHAAHLDHCLRGKEAEQDAAFCRTVCETCSVPFTAGCADVRALGRELGQGIEAAGRTARHQLFASIADRHAPAIILLAHHEDDQVETLRMRKQRGAGPCGMVGMRQAVTLNLDHTQIHLRRPLLGHPRTRLAEYAVTRNLDWREDSSNEAMCYERNRVRRDLKHMADLGMASGYRQLLLAECEEARAFVDRLEPMAREYLDESLRAAPGGWLLGFRGSHRKSLLDMCLRIICSERFGVWLQERSVYAATLHLQREGRVGAVLQLPGNIRLRKESDGLFFYRAPDEPLPPEGELLLPEAIPFRVRGLGLVVEAAYRDLRGPDAIPVDDREDACIQWMAPTDLHPPLTLRARRDGDRLQPLGAPGQRKVKDILIDRKVPQRQKADCRVLCDEEGILWLWPHCLAERVRITAETRPALRFVMRRQA